MNKKTVIEITINKNDISLLHSTITSIIEQTNISQLNIHIRFINSKNLNLTSEIQRLKSSKVKIFTNLDEPYFLLKLQAGTIISKSFLYKGINLLARNNNIVFTCPEYTFQRLENTHQVLSFHGHNQLLPSIQCPLINLDKIQNSNNRHAIIRSQPILGECAILPEEYSDYNDWCANLERNKFSFCQTIYNKDNIALKQLYPIDNHYEKPLLNKIKTFVSSSLSAPLLRKVKSFLHKKPSPQPISVNALPKVHLNPILTATYEQLANINWRMKGIDALDFRDATSISSNKPELFYKYYQQIINTLLHKQYNYIMLLPWIIRGGIDLFAINYLKAISKLYPNEHIAVFLTDNTFKSFTKKELSLPDNIEIIQLQDYIKNPDFYHKYAPDILYLIIHTLSPNFLHILSTKVAYECLYKYCEELHQQAKIIFSSYNFLISNTGEYCGYHIQELPHVYRQGDTITTDNNRAKRILSEHFGIYPSDIFIHNQSFDIPPTPIHASRNSKDGIKILWAAHIRPEKNPEILSKIASIIEKDNIAIDCYGIFKPDYWEDHQNPIKTNQQNLTYIGPYDNFFEDINLSSYDLFLYTSHTDGTPNVIIEAALAGLPIVSSKIGGIPDILKDRGYLVQNTNSAEDFVKGIMSILKNRTKSIENATLLQKEFQEKYSSSHFLENVKNMLDRSK